MWKKVNLVGTHKIWRQWSASAARFWLKSNKKEKRFSVQQSGIAKSGLREKKNR
jgi:hypothetical protein